MAIRKRPSREGLALMKETGCTKDELPSSMITWLADYRDASGARRFKQFRTQTEAKAYAARATVDSTDGRHVADSQSKTVAGTAELWLKRCREGDPTGDPGPLEVATVREYERHVGYFTDSEIGIGKIKLTKLTLADVDAFLRRLRERGKGKPAATARKVRTSLSIMLGFALEQKLVARHVLREVRRRRKAEREQKAIVIPTKAHLRAMLADQDSPLWFRAFLTTAIHTGMRASELRGLDWRYVDLIRGVIKVRQRADFAGIIGAPKSKAGNRDITMTKTVRQLLDDLRMSAPPTGGLVFASKSGRSPDLTNICRGHYHPLQERLGISPRYGVHALRHAAASMMIEQGWNAKRVQTIMGHSSIQVTYNVYGHLFRDDAGDQAAMDALEEGFAS